MAKAKVVIVGGGFAGCAAAIEVTKAGAQATCKNSLIMTTAVRSWKHGPPASLKRWRPEHETAICFLTTTYVPRPRRMQKN